ncbi:hypothetical protein GA0070216_12048 [Micromonospora matsumotoense]|uniref:Uncharacterized protein n=1 Tax=Micromonospora matsumotoense TaxID=121616 RepID=A0A1C5ANC7_9ACTN|nr:hypothetical protein [Micromonospora matsumotoense]SCF46697.1 hypothetical protein GA0070216_12048 [Micromonospora matsumotoense]
MEQRRLLASLCAAVPTLRERAEAGLWSDLLDELLDDLAAGRPVVEVCQQLGWRVETETETERSGTGPSFTDYAEGAQLEGLAPVVLNGDYRCPRHRCSRRAHRDDRGRVPHCALAGTPMTYRAEP